MTAEEKWLFNRINQERQAAGRKPLKWGGRLEKAARRHSRDMVNSNFFAHVSPTRGNLVRRLHEVGIGSWKRIGENVAGAATAELAFQVWMLSPKHKASMLKPSYTTAGIGIAQGGPYGAMFTIDFADEPH